MAWLEPPVRMRLEAGQVHVWRAELDPVAPEIERRREALSPDERERAARFRVPRVQLRFTAGRVILRDILSRYLDCPPSAISFGYRQHGKPFLLPIPGGERLRFNLSHSHGLALYGVSLDAEIGIDLEQVRRDRDHEKLARRFFAPEETGALLALPPEQRLTAFFECWTRKEAYLKARGEGLAIPLDSFEVSLAPGSAAGLLRVADDPGETRRWSLVALDPGPGFAAALAVESRPADVRLWQWRAANKG